ncbi:ribonuclease H-like domain-containing protein [Tanacetum coccineum]|uniref:Ribonuclease H-like domain-containing protein n=1 Tax=Tanacetum coccineum TaxID=301880 RepID=A0ABQ5FFT6_9ASTR
MISATFATTTAAHLTTTLVTTSPSHSPPLLITISAHLPSVTYLIHHHHPFRELRLFGWQTIKSVFMVLSQAQGRGVGFTVCTSRDLLHEDLEQIDDLDIEEIDINWQIAMIAIRMKKFYKKTGRRVRVDGKTPIGFDKKKLECFNYHNTGHFARECTAKETRDGKKKRDSFYQHQQAGKQEKNQMGLLTMDDGIVN